MSKDELRKKILKLTKEYFQLNFRESGFKAGEDSVKYAGRVFDENELIYLVDSSLDFWLTAGRFAKKLASQAGMLRFKTMIRSFFTYLTLLNPIIEVSFPAF